MSSQDNRRHPRIDTKQAVWVEGQDVRISAEARNMSKGGMFVVSEGDAPAVGTTLRGARLQRAAGGGWADWRNARPGAWPATLDSP